jgi:hypothetical protein
VATYKSGPGFGGLLASEVGSLAEANAGAPDAATGLLQGQCHAVALDTPLPVVELAQPAAVNAADAASELSQRETLRTRHLLAVAPRLMLPCSSPILDLAHLI